MLTKEQALEFSKLILADQPEADVKFQFLSDHIKWSTVYCRDGRSNSCRIFGKGAAKE